MPIDLDKAADEILDYHWSYEKASDVSSMPDGQLVYVLLRDIAASLRAIRDSNQDIELRLITVEQVAKNIQKRFKKIDDAAKEEFGK